MKDDVWILWRRRPWGGAPVYSALHNRDGDDVPMLTQGESAGKLFSPLKVKPEHRLFSLDALAKLYPLPVAPAEALEPKVKLEAPAPPTKPGDEPWR